MARRSKKPPSIRRSQRSPPSGSGDPTATTVNAPPPLPEAATTVDPLSSSTGSSLQSPPRPRNYVFALGSAMARRTGTLLRSRRPPSIPRFCLPGPNRVEYPTPVNARHQQSPPAAANRSPVSSSRRERRRSSARRQQPPPAGANRPPQESPRTPQAALRYLVEGRRTTYLRDADDDKPFSDFILWIDLNQRGILHWLVSACALETPSIPHCDDPEFKARLYHMINLEGELGRILGQLDFYKKMDEYAKQKFLSDLIKRSGNQTNHGSEDVGPSSGVSHVIQDVEQQGPLISDQTSNETENVGPSADVEAVQQQEPLSFDQTNDDSENVGPSEGLTIDNQYVDQEGEFISDQKNKESENAGPSAIVGNVQDVDEPRAVISDETNSELIVLELSSGEPVNCPPPSSAPRFGKPFPLDVQNESVIVTARAVLLEPPREPSPLFVEYKDRRASVEFNTDSSGVPFSVQRHRIEQVWMEVHEALATDSDEPPSYVNFPPPSPATIATGPASSPTRFRLGERYRHNVTYEEANVTVHRVHREPPAQPSAGEAQRLILYVEARGREPCSSEVFPAGNHFIRTHQFRVQRLLLDIQHEVNQNQLDHIIGRSIFVRGTNVGPPNQQVNARAVVSNVVESAPNESNNDDDAPAGAV